MALSSVCPEDYMPRPSAHARVSGCLVCILLVAASAAGQIRTTERVSTVVNTAGSVLQPGTVGGASLSSDGRFVVFESDAPTFVAGDTNGVRDVFVKDRATNAITRVSVATPVGGVAAQGNGVSGHPASGGSVISGDGRLVAFTSLATNLVPGDTNGQSDVFVHDRVTKVTRRVSLSASGAQLAGASVHGALSTDGRYLTFHTSSTVVPGLAGTHVYRVSLAATANAVALVSQNSNEVPGNGISSISAISADGRHVAFESAAGNLDLRVTDTNQAVDVFVRDMQAGETARVSVQTDGRQTFVFSPGSVVASHPAISGNGRFVAFTVLAAMKLVSNDNNSQHDVYVRDRDVDGNGVLDEAANGVKTFRVSVNTSGADADGASSNPTVSVDGRFVSFLSFATNLVTPARDEGFGHVYVRDLDSDCDGGTGRAWRLRHRYQPGVGLDRWRARRRRVRSTEDISQRPLHRLPVGRDDPGCAVVGHESPERCVRP